MTHSLRACFAFPIAVIMLLLGATPVAADAVEDRGVTDLLVPEWYAQTSWPQDHRDTRNSDFSPYIVPTERVYSWSAIDRIGLIPGAATVFASTQGTDGNLYMTNGRGRGFRHVHGFDDETGAIIFTVPPFIDGDNTPDFASITGTPTHDEDGNFYMMDEQQIWSWDIDGNLRWVTDVTEIGFTLPEDTILNPILMEQGYVGGISNKGNTMWLNTDDGSLATDILNLPGGPGPECDNAWLLLWLGGEVSIEVKRIVYCIFFGFEVENANTAALHPETGRVFVAATGPMPDVGALYALDLVGDTDGNGLPNWEVTWTALIGAGGGASPTLSPDLSTVYVTDGANVLWAINTDDGSTKWTRFGGEAAASPSIGPLGNLYASADTAVISIGDEGDQGVERWLVNYDDVAAQFLPVKRPVPFLVPNGNPIAVTASVLNPSPGVVNVPMIFGYEYALGTLLLGRTSVLTHVNTVIQVRQEDGAYVENSAVVVPDAIDGAQTSLLNGRAGVTQGAIFSGLAAYLFNFTLPPRFWSPIPKAGYVGIEPKNFCNFALEQVETVIGYTETAQQEVPDGDLQRAYDELRRGRLQLTQTGGTLAEAVERGELKSKDVADASAGVDEAHAALDEAVDTLLGNPSDDDLQSALELAESAGAALEEGFKKVKCKKGKGG